MKYEKVALIEIFDIVTNKTVKKYVNTEEYSIYKIIEKVSKNILEVINLKIL